MPAEWWQERPLKHIKLLSLFIPQRIIDQSELWSCFNNVPFTIHWLPSTHSIINFTHLFSKSTWFCKIWGEGAVALGEGRAKGESHLLSSFISKLHQLGRLTGNCHGWRRDWVWGTNISPAKSSVPAKTQSLRVPQSVSWEAFPKEAWQLHHRAASSIDSFRKKAPSLPFLTVLFHK